MLVTTKSSAQEIPALDVYQFLVKLSQGTKSRQGLPKPLFFTLSPGKPRSFTGLPHSCEPKKSGPSRGETKEREMKGRSVLLCRRETCPRAGSPPRLGTLGGKGIGLRRYPSSKSDGYVIVAGVGVWVKAALSAQKKRGGKQSPERVPGLTHGKAQTQRPFKGCCGFLWNRVGTSILSTKRANFAAVSRFVAGNSTWVKSPQGSCKKTISGAGEIGLSTALAGNRAVGVRAPPPREEPFAQG